MDNARDLYAIHAWQQRACRWWQATGIDPYKRAPAKMIRAHRVFDRGIPGDAVTRSFEAARRARFMRDRVDPLSWELPRITKRARTRSAMASFVRVGRYLP